MPLGFGGALYEVFPTANSDAGCILIANVLDKLPKSIQIARQGGAAARDEVFEAHSNARQRLASF